MYDDAVAAAKVNSADVDRPRSILVLAMLVNLVPPRDRLSNESQAAQATLGQWRATVQNAIDKRDALAEAVRDHVAASARG
ncbi:MAG TPA: hypothetical protein VI365_33820 [Trebonia sp.]